MVDNGGMGVGVSSTLVYWAHTCLEHTAPAVRETVYSYIYQGNLIMYPAMSLRTAIGMSDFPFQ